MTDNLHVPPQSLEAEQHVLGAIFLDPRVLDDIDLTRGDFYRESHCRIYEAMKGLEVVDLVTVSEALKRSEDLEAVGGASYLANIATAAPTAANAGYHARILREFSDRRRILRACQQTMAGIHSESVEDLLSGLVVNVDGPGQDNIKTMAEVMQEVDKRIKYRSEHRDELIGVSTGLVGLDIATGGLMPGDLIIIGARPGMGKSALADQIATGAAMSGVPAHICNVEMSNEQLGMRMLSKQSNISGPRLRGGQIEEDKEAYRLAKAELSRLPITFDDVSFKLNDIQRSFNKAYRRGMRLGILDYIQLVRNSGKGKSREREIGEIPTMLKQLAKSLRIPVVALAQLNREVDKRENKRPVLSDLRDSGQLEQDADVIIFLYREGYYNKRIEDNTAEIIIRKGRHIGTGKIPLVGWDGPRTRFFEREVF